MIALTQAEIIPAEWETVIQINGYNSEIDSHVHPNSCLISAISGDESESRIFAGGGVVID